MTLSELATKVIGDKRRWRAYKARTRQLPATYRTTMKALERYLLRFGPADAETAATVFEDLATLFEQAAAGGTPVRELVGDNSVGFVKNFLRSYPQGGMSAQERDRLIGEIVAEDPVVFEAFLKDYVTGGWVARECKRLNGAIDRAEGEAAGAPKVVAR